LVSDAEKSVNIPKLVELVLGPSLELLLREPTGQEKFSQRMNRMPGALVVLEIGNKPLR
jgi:hypothetical protein